MHGNGSVPSTTADSNIRRSRSGGSRRGLPTGRALVGGLLVPVAAVVVFAAYAGAEDRPSSSVVVARRALDPGQRLTLDDVEVRSIDVPADVADRSFSDASRLVGAVALGPIGAGELVQQGSVRADAADGTGPEFSFAVDRERALAGDVRSGEEVDLLATFGSGSDASTVVVARSARVLHVQEARNGTLGSSGRLVLTVRLASGDEVVDVAHASQVAVITLVRASGDGTPGASGTATSPPRGTPSSSSSSSSAAAAAGRGGQP
jgi:Flp pilus assembly protein CpaB